MRFPEYKYVGVKQDLRSETKICPMDSLPTPIPGKEYYVSVYRFPEEVVSLPSLGNLPPDLKCFTDWIIWDFDSKDLGEAKKDAQYICGLFDYAEVPYEIWFSGNKGFHVYLPSEVIGLEPLSNVSKIQAFAKHFAGHLKTWDPSIYNKSRVIRDPNSWNIGGQRFKISLVNLDFTVEKILDLALENNYGTIPAGEVEVNSDLKKIWDSLDQPVAQNYNRVVVEQDPKHGGSVFVRAEEGKRNETAYTVARKLARKGVSFADARSIINEVWNISFCDPPLGEQELIRVIENAYSKGVNISASDDFSGSIHDIDRSLGEVGASFKAQGKGFLTGYEMLDRYTMGFQPEDLIFIPGRSGTFKSCVLTNILQRGSLAAKKHALYFSMEMGKETLIPRTVQQAYGVTKKEAINALKSGENLKEVQEQFGYLKFCYLSNLSTDQVLGIIDAHLEKFGSLSAIGFDYLGLFRGCNNNTERTAKQAQELKTIIAKTARCPVFCLTQAKQIYEGREGDIELDRNCNKDSDSVLDLGDYVMGLWNHWALNPHTGEEEKFLFGRFLKSRGMDDEAYGVNPYVGVAIDKRYMRVNDFVHVSHPPIFKQKGQSSD